ncbi:MAG: CHRD domain-containing protein [Planctomycetota bacterium]|jgi:hypothetical protein
MTSDVHSDGFSHAALAVRSSRAVAMTIVLLGASAAPAATVTKVAILGGQQAVPPVASPASGCALISIDTEANRLSYHIAYGGLLGGETVAHFHGPAVPGTNGGVMHSLPAGSPKIGTWTYDESQEEAILAGNVYINIHSTMFAAGELRGQVVDMVAPLDGAQVNPPVATGAQGFGLFNVDTCANELSYYIFYDGLSSAETVAHIHGFAMQTANAGVLHGLPLGSPKIGTWTYAESAEQALLDGRAYVNIHSANHGGGEIRGQITRIVAPLDGVQAVPPTTTAGRGCGLLAIDREADQLSYYLRYGDLTGPATAAHVHGYAPPGAAAGVRHGIGTANPAKGTWSYPAADEPSILGGLAYFNVHTGANPGGEIRGQIVFPAPPCLGDVNCDGAIDVDDLVEVILQWGTDDPAADVNGDGTVDVDDLVAVILGWGPCP